MALAVTIIVLLDLPLAEADCDHDCWYNDCHTAKRVAKQKNVCVGWYNFWFGSCYCAGRECVGTFQDLICA